MINLYIDFDGVMMDTIRVSTEILNNLEINTEDVEQVRSFYRNLDWEELLATTPILKDAFVCLDKLFDCKKFNIYILTHVNSLNEAICKINFIREYTDEVTIIPVPREISKTKMCKIEGAILVDDYSGNLKDWKSEGGISIKFSTDLNKESDYPIIDSLDKLIEMF